MRMKVVGGGTRLKVLLGRPFSPSAGGGAPWVPGLRLRRMKGRRRAARALFRLVMLSNFSGVVKLHGDGRNNRKRGGFKPN